MLMLIACITMLIDHIGCVLPGDNIVLRFIGRIAMPIYAYLLVNSCLYTTNIKKYFKRLVVIAALSQLPYMIVSEYMIGNICVTWTLCAVIITALEKTDSLTVRLFVITPSVIALIIIPMDYGFYAFTWVLLFYMRHKNPETGTYALIIGSILCNLIYGNKLQYASIIALPIILICENTDNVRLENKKLKQCYRWFYPTHMAVLSIIQIYLTIDWTEYRLDVQ